MGHPVGRLSFFSPLFLPDEEAEIMYGRTHGQPFVLLQNRVQMGSKEGAELVSSVMASFTPGQTGHHLEKRVTILEGNISHSRLVVERSFPFKTESKRPHVHAPSPNLLGWQGSSHRRRPNYKPPFLPPPKQKLPDDKHHVNRYMDTPGTAVQVNKMLESPACCTVNSVTLGKSTVRDEINKS